MEDDEINMEALDRLIGDAGECDIPEEIDPIELLRKLDEFKARSYGKQKKTDIPETSRVIERPELESLSQYVEEMEEYARKKDFEKAVFHALLGYFRAAEKKCEDGELFFSRKMSEFEDQFSELEKLNHTICLAGLFKHVAEKTSGDNQKYSDLSARLLSQAHDLYHRLVKKNPQKTYKFNLRRVEES